MPDLHPYTAVLSLNGKEQSPHTFQAVSTAVAKEVARQFLVDHNPTKEPASIRLGKGDDVAELEWIGAWDFEDGGFSWAEDS